MGGMEDLNGKINEAAVLLFKSFQPGTGIQNFGLVPRRLGREELYHFSFLVRLCGEMLAVVQMNVIRKWVV